MVIGAFLLAAAAQAAAPAAAQAEICTLVTPRGDLVRVAAMAWSSDGTQLGLIPVAGGVWPREAIVGTRNRAGRGRAGGPRFLFGNARGLAFELGERLASQPARSATLFRNAESGPGLPLAFGYCAFGPAPPAEDAVDTSAQPAAVGADIPAFDPALWPEQDCAMLLGDGRRIRLGFDLRGRDAVSLSSAELWGGRRLMADMRWLPSGVGLFDHDGGPTGTAANYGVDSGSSAAKLISFQSLGGNAAESLKGYAICGYQAVVRRAVAQ
ncbi:MAG TPA: hypothetical protein VMG08_17895 [Allosphingosinicella sp.]|nr:hypothetical protein [Allosphingosinicella sp.]